MTVILLAHRPNYSFYVIRSPGESMAEFLFPSRLSNVILYHSLIICCIVTNNSCIKKHAIYKESLEVREIKPYSRFSLW